jgi:SAM-dependent methyltransferase
VAEPDPDEHTRHLAAESLALDDPTGWFERLYVEAAAGAAVVPWDRGVPQPLLVQWAQRREPAGHGSRALVVGCGFGADAEFVAGLGFDTVAFDVSETAVRSTRSRFPGSPVDYVVADLLDPPAGWREGFDLVVECLTVQSLPRTVRERATANVGRFVAAGGTLVVISVVGKEDSAVPGPPWPLTRAEVEAFADDTLTPVDIEDVGGRWLAEFRRRDR